MGRSGAGVASGRGGGRTKGNGRGSRVLPALIPGLLALLLAAFMLAGCGEDSGDNSSDSSTTPTLTEVSSPEEAVRAALAWATAAPLRVRLGGEEGSEVLYGAGGEPGRLEYLGDPREPLLPDPLVWDADTHYLDLRNFSVPRMRTEALAIDFATLETAVESKDEQWREFARGLGVSFALYRSRDPLRMLRNFDPLEDELPAPEDGQVSLRGQIDPHAAIESEFLVGLLESVEGVERFLPERLSAMLVLSAEDWRPLELRLSYPSEPEAQELVAEFERAEEGPEIPEGYPRLSDYTEPAADPAELLETVADWLDAQPVEVIYPEGSAVLDGGASAFRVVDPPGDGAWAATFAESAKLPLSAGDRYYWQRPGEGEAGWLSTNWEELQSAARSKLAVPLEERDAQTAQTVYDAIVRSYLLDVLNPRWWVATALRSASTDREGPALAVSEVEGGYELRGGFVDDALYPSLPAYELLIYVGNPPPGIDAGGEDYVWNYSHEYQLVLRVDADGTPRELRVEGNAPDGFAELQDLRMTFARTDERLSPPEDATPLLELLGGEK